MNDPEAACFLAACAFMQRKQSDHAQIPAQARIETFLQVYSRHKKELFVFRNGHVAGTLEELLDLCRQYPEDGLYHLREGHFESWFKYVGLVDWYFYADAASHIRTSSTQKTAPEQMEAFIAQCKLLRERDPDSGDGQHWVAGWD
jgi:hypothetical protein